MLVPRGSREAGEEAAVSQAGGTKPQWPRWAQPSPSDPGHGLILSASPLVARQMEAPVCTGPGRVWGWCQRPHSLSRHSAPRGMPDGGESGTVTKPVLSPLPPTVCPYNLLIITRAQSIRTAICPQDLFLSCKN